MAGTVHRQPDVVHLCELGLFQGEKGVGTSQSEESTVAAVGRLTKTSGQSTA